MHDVRGLFKLPARQCRVELPGSCGSSLKKPVPKEPLPTSSMLASRTASIFNATEIYPEHVVLDGNHPLAGIAIRLALKIEAVREASVDEVGKGSLGTGFFRLEPQVPGNSTRH